MYTAAVLAGLTAMALTAPLAVRAPQSNFRGQGRPVNNRPGATNYTASFEDLTGNGVADILTGLLASDEVGPYDGLDYQNIFLADLSTVAGGIIGGVQPRSGSAVGVYGNVVQALLADGSSDPTITTQYPGSVVRSFDFNSFYFGCDTILAVGPAAPCQVTVFGYRNTQEVGVNTFTFYQNGVGAGGIPVPIVIGTGGVQMQRATLDESFNRVDTVRFQTAGLPLGGVLSSTLLDNLNYVTYNDDGLDGQENNNYNNNNGEHYGTRHPEAQTTGYYHDTPAATSTRGPSPAYTTPAMNNGYSSHY